MADSIGMTPAAGAMAEPEIRRINAHDLREALRKGVDDFMATPTQLIFLCILYPLIGVMFAVGAAQGNLLPLIYPMVAGFALVGPLAALGLYEISRRREAGQPVSVLTVFEVRKSPAIIPIAALGVILVGIFLAWLTAARLIADATIGAATLPTMGTLVDRVLGTAEGWQLILWGNLVGFLFAATVLLITVVSFPLLLDRNVPLGVAVRTSIRAFTTNPATMALWGLFVGAALLAGSALLFVGLAVVLPVLGHATWHLYRRVVV
jgi:uncharacterized membrane protein